ncbi:MAG: hypothetical protein JXK04_05980 [Campylobacterales bacterium]|nr:hypothetical protein [Campylobacterales bacterium]
MESNTAMRLLYRNAPFACEPFGVIPLEKMPAAAPDPQACRERIGTWYRSYPGERHFASERLRLQQTYRFERIREGCVLYANGPESYSEMLLGRGLAVIDPAFDNKEWNARLQRAQKGAQRNKRGLHDSEILKYCIKEED